MGIRSRSLLQQQIELLIERNNPQKVALIRARPFNCVGGSCFQNGRTGISALCPVCFGTGYLGLVKLAGVISVLATGNPFDDMQPPASDLYRIYGDVQTGHGLYGAGGEYMKILGDLGRQETGDGTLYCKMIDYDAITGREIYPIVDADFVRPDRIITTYDTIFNAVEQLIAEIGSEAMCRIFVLEKGSFSAVRGVHG